MYQTILVPLDGSALSEGALPAATMLAQKTGGRLVLVRAIWPVGWPRSDLAEAHFRDAQEAAAYLEYRARRLSQQGIAVDTVTPHTPPAKGILGEIELCHADLVVMTTHGHSGLGRWLYGSVAEAVLRASPVPVWLVRAWTPTHSTLLEPSQPRILVPVDGSPIGEAVLPHAITMAKILEGRIVLLHVLEALPISLDPRVSEALLEGMVIHDRNSAHHYLEGLATQVTAAGVGVETVVRTGKAVDTILAEVWGSDIGLVVMATHGWTGVERLLFGSVTTEVLRRGTCPLMVIRPSVLARQATTEAAEAVVA